MRRKRSPRQSPAPSILLPEATSTAAFLWGAWFTPPLPTGYLKLSKADVQRSQKKWPSFGRDTAGNSITERNQKAPCWCKIQQVPPNRTQLRLVSGTLPVGRQQIPRCSPFACWLFEPESNMSLLSALGRITRWLFLWWPCSPALVCARVCKQLTQLCMHAFAGDTCVPARPPSSPAGAEWVTAERTACAAAFCPLAPLRSAQLRSVKPQITHSLGSETEEEEGMEGGNKRDEELHTLRRGWTVSFLSLYRISSNTLSAPSQFGCARWRSQLVLYLRP